MVQLLGPAQHGVAKAVADSVAEGGIPIEEADDLFISVGALPENARTKHLIRSRAGALA